MLDFSHPSSICWTGCPGDLVPRYQSASKERLGRWVTPRITSTNFKRRTTRLSVSPGGDGDGGEDEERVSEGRTLELKMKEEKISLWRVERRASAEYCLLEIFWRISGPLCNVHHLDQSIMMDR